MKLHILLFLLVIPVFTSAQNTRGVKQTDTATSKEGETYAIVIGISKYKDVTPLQYADRDAQRFAKYLTDRTGMGLKQANVKLFTNSQATLLSVGSAISQIMRNEIKKGDKFIFYFAGHGDYDGAIFTNQALLLLYGAPKTNYFDNVFGGDFISTANLNSSVIDPLTAKGCQVILIVDACHATGTNVKLSGGAEGGKVTMMALQNMTPSIQIYSCKANEYSLEGEQWDQGSGLFSYVLMDGLRGLADANKDQKVTLRELQRYLEDSIPGMAAPNKQEPIIKADDPSQVIAKVDKEGLALHLEMKRGGNNPRHMKLPKPMIGQGMSDSQRYYFYSLSSLIDAQDWENAYTQYLLYKNYDDYGEESLHLLRKLSNGLQNDAASKFSRVSLNVSNESAEVDSVDNAALNLSRASEILGDKHFLHNQLEARVLFLKAVSIYLNHKRNSTSPQSAADASTGIKYLKESLLLDPNLAYNHLYLAKLYTAIRDTAHAMESIHHFLELVPGSSSGYTMLANVLFNSNKTEEGLLNYKKAIALATSSHDSIIVYNDMANAFLSEKKYKEATENFTRVLDLNPRVELPYLALAGIELKQGNYAQALAISKQALALELKTGEAEFLTAEVYAAMKNPQMALQALDSSIMKGFKNLGILEADHYFDKLRTEKSFKTIIMKSFTADEISKYPKLFARSR